jgi:hypothetical protein
MRNTRTEDSRTPLRTAVSIETLCKGLDDFRQGQQFYHRGSYRTVSASRLCLFFFVTRLKPPLVVSGPLCTRLQLCTRAHLRGFFSRIVVPRGRSDGYMAFPRGLIITVRLVPN